MKRRARYLYRLGLDVAHEYGRTSASQFAAAISYRALFSLVPLATFAVMVGSSVLVGNEERREQFVDAVAETLQLTDDGVASLDRVVDAVPSPWSLPGLIAIAVALWGATGVMSSVRKALAVVFDSGEVRSFARGKLVDGLLVGCAVVLMLVAIGLSLLHQLLSRLSERVERALGWEPRGVDVLLGYGVPLALTAGVFLLLLRLLPRNRPAWRAALIGATAGAVGFQAIQVGLSWYLAGPGNFSSVYASAGAVFAFLLSVYLGASAFLVGAILTAVLAGNGEELSPGLVVEDDGSREEVR